MHWAMIAKGGKKKYRMKMRQILDLKKGLTTACKLTKG